MTDAPWDAVIVGGGHNGLVAGFYLARAGLRTLILERRPFVGGACNTEEFAPGFRASTGAYVLSMLRPAIWTDMKLVERGIVVDPAGPTLNLYPDGAQLGLHQDGEEPSDAPVVTVSLGDTCTFRFAGVDRRVGPFLDVELRSGDLLVFGREQRRVFHGVPKVVPATAPAGLGLPPGRLSITVRETGFS